MIPDDIDRAIDEIINTPDDEILEQVRKDYGDPEFEANIMRRIIKSCIIETEGKENKDEKRNEQIRA